MESTGNIVFPNFRTVRELAYAINVQRGTIGNGEKEVRAGFLNAAGLLDEIGHYLVRLYDEQENPGVIARAARHAEKILGAEVLNKTLLQFIQEFPPKAVYQGLQTAQEYFVSSIAGRPNRDIALEELIMLHLANINPAHKRIKELFDDTTLISRTSYIPLLSELEKFFAGERPFGPDAQPLFTVLKRPILEHPENIEAQLGYFRERWGIVLSTKFIERIGSSLEFNKEEEVFLWHAFNPAGGKPDVQTFVPEYRRGGKALTEEERRSILRQTSVRPEDHLYAEPEQFTPDIEWMPNVVLIAKNTYVWLDQLSKQYGREIKRLDQIPDAELDQLQRWNYTSLWLIGVWERSVASKRIKQINGNLDAVSSAYSLYDYEIAHDIGGEEAFQDLNRRCWQRGIRLAGDMVPNHMGLYSKWVIEHPEFFIQSEHSPYPNYRFTGENLSHHPDIEIRIEDGYWSRSDAAVVFQRIDTRSGEVRYYYHGNDGTSMPWNDTAQLNMLRADVREAVIQSIFHVARKFSVIRFDAAMTLAKKHFQRLWYPMPGTSGVPSRQDHSLSRAEFDAMFPNEFWREVVDRFNDEMPQTLLLAEAFWLMEGYFVRTLGMHRVYNSAFMHMLMKEENQKFRAMIKNTLEFNPEILKRYVNFMSNPDEQTAVEQFGKDDKYFGVATLMVTLPGLPMFAHGQIEGFKEKYGMEYQRAYYNETADEWLVRRHEHEIFPLTKKRYLFSQVYDFEFYDFLDDRGQVNENVIAYSNRAGNERAVIFFHNTFAECSGSIKHSLQKAVNEQGAVRSVTLGGSFQLRNDDDIYYRFRNRKTELEYLVAGRELNERGIRVTLRAFEYAVFTDFVEMKDANGALRAVAEQLHGNGTRTLDVLLAQVRLQPFHIAFAEAFRTAELLTIDRWYPALLEQAVAQLQLGITLPAATPAAVTRIPLHDLTVRAMEHQRGGAASKEQTVLPALLYRFTIDCRSAVLNVADRTVLRDIIAELQLSPVFRAILTSAGVAAPEAEEMVRIIDILAPLHDLIAEENGTPASMAEALFGNFAMADLIGVHQFQDVWYFNKERFAAVAAWCGSIRSLYRKKRESFPDITEVLIQASDASGYQVERLKETLITVPVTEKKPAKKGTKKGNSVPVKKVKGNAKKEGVVKSSTKRTSRAKTSPKATDGVKKVTRRRTAR